MEPAALQCMACSTRPPHPNYAIQVSEALYTTRPPIPRPHIRCTAAMHHRHTTPHPNITPGHNAWHTLSPARVRTPALHYREREYATEKYPSRISRFRRFVIAALTSWRSTSTTLLHSSSLRGFYLYCTGSGHASGYEIMEVQLRNDVYYCKVLNL